LTLVHLSYSILGLGVSLAIKGHYASKKSDFGIGLGLAAAGLVAVIAAALGFGAAVSRINKRWVRLCLGHHNRVGAADIGKFRRVSSLNAFL
jgi:Kef-type K+ transport system membrane component KefB